MWDTRAVQQWSRRMVAVGCSALFLMDLADWGGPWLGALAFALGVSLVVVELSGRRLRNADAPTTLNIQG